VIKAAYSNAFERVGVPALLPCGALPGTFQQIP
jgi:hypothetical protein